MTLAETLEKETAHAADETIADIEAQMKQAASNGRKMIVVKTFDDMDNQHIMQHFRDEGVYARLRYIGGVPYIMFEWGYKPPFLRRMLDILYVHIHPYKNKKESK